jgi:hypothetical protein
VEGRHHGPYNHLAYDAIGNATLRDVRTRASHRKKQADIATCLQNNGTDSLEVAVRFLRPVRAGALGSLYNKCFC